jgi:hypothetical protein
LGVVATVRTSVWVGIALIACAPFTLLIGNLLGLLPNLAGTIQIIIISLVPTMIVSGGSLIWLGRKPDEQELSRKRDIHAAIKEWVESSPNVANPYPLAARPPELGVEIENCLSKKYPSIWGDVQKLRGKRSELLLIESGSFPDEFWENVNGREILHMDAIEGRKLSIRDQLVTMERQVREQIGREIVERHFTELKC